MPHQSGQSVSVIPITASNPRASVLVWHQLLSPCTAFINPQSAIRNPHHGGEMGMVVCKGIFPRNIRPA